MSDTFRVVSPTTHNVYETESRAEYVNLKAAGYRDAGSPAPQEPQRPERPRRPQPSPVGDPVSADEINVNGPAGA